MIIPGKVGDSMKQVVVWDGIELIEIAIALGILAVGLIAIGIEFIAMKIKRKKRGKQNGNQSDRK